MTSVFKCVHSAMKDLLRFVEDSEMGVQYCAIIVEKVAQFATANAILRIAWPAIVNAMDVANVLHAIVLAATVELAYRKHVAIFVHA